ncbi:HAD-like domain-containing protein [Aspergillus egyptiacus]|nr:HAD-like domain-containing protein [Aspergillus egyptiacus]
MRPLLLTLDAFNTLFHPRHPIPTQYASSASAFHIPVSASSLQPAFRASYKALSASHPNYGRDLALRGEYAGPRQWWADVIRGSFARALAESDSTVTEIPDALIQDLLDRFASARGYKLYDDVEPFFRELRARELGGSIHGRRKVVVGVVSNSDDRISSVLESLGVSIGDARAGEMGSGWKLPGFEEEREKVIQSGSQRDVGTGSLQGKGQEQGNDQRDVDFVLTSYQAGAEKPDRLVWDMALREAQSLYTEAGNGDADAGGWECIHVGDDYGKDYRGAVEAGWKAYHLPREAEAAAKTPEGTRTITSLLDLLPELGYK